MSQPRPLAADIVPHERVGEHTSETPAPQMYECDHCGQLFEGPPGGSGLFIWTRGDEVRFEEPPLCEACAMKISIGALLTWDFEEEEG